MSDRTAHCEICGTAFQMHRPSDKRRGKGRFCSRSCRSINRWKPYYDTLEQRFWSLVDSSGGPDACWPYHGSRNRLGYGRIKVRGHMTGAHRLAYQYHYGEDPDPWFICHACDNPPCCNPRHLWIGRHDDNAADAVEKRGNIGNRLMTKRRLELLRQRKIRPDEPLPEHEVRRVREEMRRTLSPSEQ